VALKDYFFFTSHSKFLNVQFLPEKKRKVLLNLGKAFPLSVLFQKMRDLRSFEKTGNYDYSQT